MSRDKIAPFVAVGSVPIILEKSKRVWPVNAIITDRRPTHGTIRKRHRQPHHNYSKATSSRFLSKMIAKLRLLERFTKNQTTSQNGT